MGLTAWPGATRAVRRTVRDAVERGLVEVADRKNLYLTQSVVGRVVDPRKFLIGHWPTAFDYVRAASVDLIAKELESDGVEGSLAEVGVYQGDFSVVLQRNLPGRMLHLFDTFSGFDRRDVQGDQACTLHRWDVQFSGTTPALVRKRLPDPDRACFHVGWFPESAAEIADGEQFALVSLDADLYEPTRAGLDWFVPRLASGGRILVHDYNNPSFPGVKRAVKDFLGPHPECSVVPIPDHGGSAVVVSS